MEVDDALEIGEKTIYVMVQLGNSLGFKVRDQWPFRRSDIDLWIAAKVGCATCRSGSSGEGK